MGDSIASDIEIEQVLARIRLEVQKRSAAESNPPDTIRVQLSEPFLPASRLSFQMNPSAHYRLADLLVFEDREFIQVAYLAVMRRAVDESGMTAYLQHLRNGMSKLEILGILCSSEEGHRASATIVGLKWRIRLLRAKQWPVIGSAMQYVYALSGRAGSQRQWRRAQGQLFASSEEFFLRTVDQFVTINRALQDIETGLGEWTAYFRTKAPGAGLAKTDSAVEQISEILLRLHALIEDKSDKGELRGQIVMARSQFRKELDEITEVKADKASLEETRRLLGKALEAKAEQRQLVAVTDHMVGLVQSRIGKEDLAPVERILGSLAKAKVDHSQLEAALAPLHESVGTLSRTKAEHAAIDGAVRDLHQALAPLEARTGDLRRNLLDQEQRVGQLQEEMRKWLPEPLSTEQLKKIAAEEDHQLDAMYASFEDRFRGTRAEIKQRQRLYLPYIRDVHAGADKNPVIDLGCGRGEWLELLRDEGLTARGVDLNRIFLAGCRELDLDVSEQDAVDYLHSLEPKSVGAVTGFHLIEHVPLKTLIALFDESLRVLSPGGLAIFETPNPSNLLVGSCNFYFDPTHRNPLPAPLTQCLLEIRGFSSTEILYLNPTDASSLLNQGEPQIQQLINQHFFGPQDYAVLARRL